MKENAKDFSFLNVPVTETIFVSVEETLSLLKGHVFHVTAIETLPLIWKSGGLRPSPDGTHSPFGNTENGYFRLKECVSFFDYRAHDTPEWEDFAYRCIPTKPIESDLRMAILYLHQRYHYALYSWEGWKEQELWNQRVVPYVECGFPGKVPLEAIERCLLLRMPSKSIADSV